MLERVLEPEVMDTVEEAEDYDSMDHSSVNQVFVEDFLSYSNGQSPLLDVGTGTAQIPIVLCEADPGVEVVAIDLAEEMLRVGLRNIEAANLGNRIVLQSVDAKNMPYEDGSFEGVISNSIVHHIPEPERVFDEMIRVSKPGGVLFVRDLLRPNDERTLEGLVQTYAGDSNEHQQKMFRESLHAALSLDELRAIVTAHGFDPDSVQATTDRHWTWAVHKSES